MAVLLAVVNYSSGLMYQMLINLIAIVLIYIPVYFLQRNDRQDLAKLLLGIGVLSSVYILSYLNFQNGRDAHSELIIFAIAFFVMLVMDGIPRLVMFCLTGIALGSLYYFKAQAFEETLDPTFYFTLVNLAVAYLGIYFFSQIYKNELDKSVKDIEKLNSELRQGRLITTSLMDNSPLFLAMLDTSGKYVIVNKKYEEAFGLSRDQMKGKHFSEVLPDELLTFHEPLIEKVLQGEPTDFYQEVNVTTGVFIHSYGKYFPVYDDQGDLKYITVFVTDITDLKEAERELKEHNMAKDKLFSVLAHDIISPINLLRNALFLSDHQVISEKDFREHIDRVRGNLTNLSHMMENLVKWAHSQFHGFTIRNEEVDLNKLIDKNVQLFQDLVSTKSIEIDWPEEQELKVLVDRGHLNLILRNLINNAIKFTPIGGRIKFCVDQVDHHVALMISDSGVGIGDEIVEALKKQQRIKSQFGTEGENGTGLGLSMCWQIARFNEWDLSVLGSQGEGTTFKLELPIAKEQVHS